MLVVMMASGLCIAGCSTAAKVHTQATPGIDYSQYHTFVLMPLPTASPVSDPGLMARISEPTLRQTLTHWSPRGFPE
jgi:hypothetical protein